MMRQKSKEPNPLEVLGLSLKIVRTFQNQPEKLVKIAQSLYRALAREAFHPDMNPDQRDDESSIKAINIAWGAVNDPEKMAGAIKSFLSRGGEFMTTAYQLSEVREELVKTKGALARSQAQIQRLEGTVNLSELVYERLVPGSNIEAPGVHVLDAANRLILTEGKATANEREHWNIIWVDRHLQAFTRDFMMSIDAEGRVREAFEETRLQFLDALASSTPMIWQYRWYPQGRLYGSSPEEVDFEKDLFEQKDLTVEAFARFVATLSPYIVIDQHLFSARVDVVTRKTMPARISVKPRTLGVIRAVTTLTGRSPTET